MNTATKSPNIFEYDNYRVYLRELYAYLKATKEHFSFRYFSRSAGFTSPNFLQLVMDGKRNLTGDSAERFIHALKLGKREAEFFRNLVRLNQASTVEEKKHYAEHLFRSSAYRKLNPLKKEQHAYYSNWYSIPVRELVGMPGFKEDAKWIAQTLRPQITPHDAAKALADLEKLGLVRRDASGKLMQAESIVSTGDEVASSAVAQFLKIMTLMGAEAVDLFKPEERDVSSVTLTLSAENFRQVKALVQKFRKELLAVANQDTAPEAVYQINFQLFPLTKVLRQDGSPSANPINPNQEKTPCNASS